MHESRDRRRRITFKRMRKKCETIEKLAEKPAISSFNGEKKHVRCALTSLSHSSHKQRNLLKYYGRNPNQSMSWSEGRGGRLRAEGGDYVCK